MQNKIFENYVHKCPVCSAELDADSKFCQYCGANLSELNSQYYDAEKQIHEARKSIEEAKENIARNQATLTTAKKSNKNVWKKIVFIIIGIFIAQLVLAVGVSLIMSAAELSFEKAKEEFCQELLNEDVDTVVVDEFDVSQYDFVGYGKSNAAGEIEQYENLYKIPFRSTDYDNTCIFTGNIVLQANVLEEIYGYQDDNLNLYADNCRFYVRWDVDKYYDESTDFLSIFDKNDFKNIKRVENLVVGDVEFECYVESVYYDEYTLIANPYRDCFIVIEVSPRYNDVDFDIEDIAKYFKQIEVNHKIQ